MCPEPDLSAEYERPHGLAVTYQKGCRCDECREAARIRQREYRASSPKARKRDLHQVRAYNYARAELVARHRDEFEMLYREALNDGPEEGA